MSASESAPVPVVVCAPPGRARAARALARRLGLSFVAEPPAEPGWLALILTESRLQLQLTGAEAPGAVHADFVRGRTAHRGRQGERGSEALARAAGARRGHRPSVIDTTAGLGRDAFVLAARGCEVTLVERHPVVDALLADGLERAAGDPEAAPVVARMTRLHADAREVLATRRADVVLLDPMHPQRGNSAAVRKDMRVFQALVGPDPDSDALLAAALGAAHRRVVVKRPRKAPPLPGPRPSGEVRGRSTRFDIYAGQAGRRGPRE
jgi:16S rRNA (guanine1516-N2)-methyltransferase